MAELEGQGRRQSDIFGIDFTWNDEYLLTVIL
jgi:hypothetical protein